MLDLTAFFNELAQSNSTVTGGAAFSALPIPGFPQHRIACDSTGAPTILLSTSEKRSEKRPLSIALEHLSIQFDIECRISKLHGGSETGSFTIIRCVEVDAILQTYFLRVVAALIESIGHSPSRSEVAQAINKLLELFRALSAPSLKAVRGLWAELFLIAQASNPAMLVAAWHSTPDAIYDFCESDQRIEVKSAGTRVRQHHFRLEQLRPPAGTDVLIASLFVECAGTGLSLGDLLERVRLRINTSPDLVFQLEQIVGLTLGQSLQRAMEERFDYELAKESIAFFNVQDVPSVSSVLPPGVSDVHFKSDLTNQTPSDPARLRSLQGIFRAAMSR